MSYLGKQPAFVPLTSADVTNALGFTPYNATNPSSFITLTQARAGLSATQNLTYDSATGQFTGPDLSGYLLSSTAASTYQTQAGMSSYLTTASAASTYQTQAGMSAYLTTSSASSTYLALAGGTLTGNLAFSGTALRITGDFSNATLNSRTAFQTSTTNGNTGVFFLPNGAAQIATIRAYNAADPTNGSFVQLQVNATAASINSDASGTGTALPLALSFANTERARVDANGLTTATDVSGKLTLGRFSNALTDSYFALGTGATGYTFQSAGGSANLVRISNAGSVGIGTDAPAARFDVNGNQAINIVDLASGTNFDLSAGNFFMRTVNGNVTFTVSNTPASRAFAFTVEITHTSGSITWFSGVQWPNNNTAPTLTTGRVHLFTFVTDNGGTTWRGAAQVNYNS